MIPFWNMRYTISCNYSTLFFGVEIIASTVNGKMVFIWDSGLAQYQFVCLNFADVQIQSRIRRCGSLQISSVNAIQTRVGAFISICFLQNREFHWSDKGTWCGLNVGLSKGGQFFTWSGKEGYRIWGILRPQIMKYIARLITNPRFQFSKIYPRVCIHKRGPRG